MTCVARTWVSGIPNSKYAAQPQAEHRDMVGVGIEGRVEHGLVAQGGVDPGEEREAVKHLQVVLVLPGRRSLRPLCVAPVAWRHGGALQGGPMTVAGMRRNITDTIQEE